MRVTKDIKAIIFVIIITQIFLLYSLADELEQKQLIEKFDQKATATVAGKVSWENRDMRRTTVQVYSDKNLKELYCSGVIASKDGSYEINVEPGRYYVVAFVDGNQNGRFDPGDGMGIYGITDWENKSQRKKPVSAVENETTSGIDIQISAMIIEIDGRNQIVPVDSEYVKQSEKFKLELDKMFTGVSGKLVWPGQKKRTHHKDVPLLVFAYADLTWRYRMATAECDENGNFKINLLPGKYYLLAVIDENQNNLFDEGDKFGIYGMTGLSSSYPQPVLLEKNKFSSEIEIPIIGVQDKSGKIVSLSDQEKIKIDSQSKAELSGKVIWQGRKLKNSVVFAYRDATLMEASGHTKAQDNGTFKLELPQGKYYLVANVDVNGDGKYSAGDGIGGYGTDDITKKHPAALALSDEDVSDVEIFITAKYEKNGQLVPISPSVGAKHTSYSELAKSISSGISGKIVWDGHDFKSALVGVAEATSAVDRDLTPQSNFGERETESLFNSAVVVSVDVEEDGTYTLPLNPGDYYVMAIVDTNRDNVAGVKDGIGVYGTRMPTQNPPQLVSVFENRITPYIDIEIGGVYIDEQNIAQIDDGHRTDIRKRYGEPEDIFRFSRFGRQIEEWWYWTQGVMFAFEELGAGWKLDKREEFEPRKSDIDQSSSSSEAPVSGKPESQPEGAGGSSASRKKPVASPPESGSNAQTEKTTNSSGKEIESIDALIYYTYDDIVWGVAPDGMHLPIGVGKCPTVSGNGVVLSLLDTDGNIHLINLENEQDSVLLKRSEMASSPSISSDGNYLAFVRKVFDRSQIFIKHIGTGEEIPLPSTSVKVDTPAWSSNGKIIAYAASGNIENPNSEDNWNIYTYDIETQRVDPISVTDADESEPAWSPKEHNVLAFSRSEGKHRQVWLATVDQDGNTTEQQLTEFGGENPAWLPDGSAIIYENNGQLWIVDVEGQDEKPLLVDGKPVFGLDPFARGL